MEISKKINSLILNIKQNDIKKQTNLNVSFKGKHALSSSSAIDSMAKAKISLDNTYTKPISYEEKIKILKDRQIDEEYYEFFLSQNDKDFKKTISYIDSGYTPEQIILINNNCCGIDSLKKALELSKFGVPFNFAKDLYYFYSIPEEKIGFLKTVKFDFSTDKQNFKADTYRLKDVLSNDDSFAKFNSVYQKGVDANIALASSELNDDEYRELIKSLDEEKDINNSATAAYFLSHFTQEDINGVIELSKANKLDYNNYDFWINTKKLRNISETGKLLELGIPADCLPKNINLNNEQLQHVLSLASEYEIAVSDVIDIYQYSSGNDNKIKRACELLKENNFSPTVASNLADFDKSLADSIIKYIKRGLEYNTALDLALLEKNEQYKEKIISLLDIFNCINEADLFLSLNLSEENSKKALDLIKKGANISFANLCVQSPSLYNKVTSIIDAGDCDSLSGIYANNEDEASEYLDFIKMGINADMLSSFSYGVSEEDLNLLRSGIKYKELKPLKEYEERKEDSSLIKEFLKKGITFEDALSLKELSVAEDIPKEIITENIYAGLDAKKIIALAHLQQNRGNNWISSKEKDILVEFLRYIKDIEKIDEHIDLGFLNKKALANYKEFIKRGILPSHSDNAIILSQLDYNDPAKFDRAVELLKRNIPFEKILFSIDDNNSFIKAIETSDSGNMYVHNTTLNSYLVRFYLSGLDEKSINYIMENCWYLSKNKLATIEKYVKKGHCVEDAINIANFSGYNDDFSGKSQKSNVENQEFISELILQGCQFNSLRQLINNKEKFQKFKTYIQQGISPKLAEKLALNDISPDDKILTKKIYEMDNSTIHEELKKLCGNPLLFPFIDELYNFNKYTNQQYGNILKSDLSIQDIFNSAKIFIKSPLKLAMKRPNAYLSGIPIEDTEKINGEFPKLSNEKKTDYQRKMLLFFKIKMVEITRALKYLDVDTFNQLMDKRTVNFSEQLDMLNKMDDEHYKLVSKIIKCRKEDGKLLSTKEKIDLAKIVLYYQLGYLDISYLEDIIKTGTVNISDIRKVLFDKLIEAIGITKQEAAQNSEKLNFDEEYMYLLLRTQKSADFMMIKELLDDKTQLEDLIKFLEEKISTPEELAHEGLTLEKALAFLNLLKRADTMEEKEIYKEYVKISPFETIDITPQDIARIAILEDFNSYIQDNSNSVGKINSQTKVQFENLGLDYNQWLKYKEKTSMEINGHNYDIKLWDRNPQKDLFMGNRTSCCTAIIDGANGKSTPIYLLNTAFNVIEVTDENGNIVAMSRIFVGNVDEKPSLIIENIEINNSFLKNKTKEELKSLRDNIFKYIKEFASTICKGKEMDIYFSKNYTHISMSDYKIANKNVDFVGSVSADSIYLNCKPGWINPNELKNQKCQFYLIS